MDLRKSFKIVTFLLVLNALLLVQCKRETKTTLSISPNKPPQGDTVLIEFSKPITGFLWLREYYGNTPFDYTLRIMPLQNTHEFKYYPQKSDVYLVVMAIEDTLEHQLLTGPQFRIVYYDRDNNPLPLAYAQLSHLYYRDDYDSISYFLNKSPQLGRFSYFDELLNTGLEQDVLTHDDVVNELSRNCPLSDTADPIVLYAGFKTAYFVLNDGKLAIDYQKFLERLAKSNPIASKYYKMTTIYTLAFDPFGKLREGREPLVLYNRFNTDTVIRNLVLMDDLLRWYMTRAFTSESNAPLFYEFVEFLEKIDDLHLEDLTVMEYVALGWMGEQDSSLLRFVLQKTKGILDDPIKFRRQYAYSYWNRISDFYRLKNRAFTDYLKTKSRYLLMVDLPDSAYEYMREFVGLHGTIFELWQEDVALFGESALKSGHIADAENAFSTLVFYYNDTSGLDYLKQTWEFSESNKGFEDYLNTLKQKIESRFPNAPDFSGRLIGGQEIRLADLKGKVVVLNFWATWCGPCRREIPELNLLVNEFSENEDVVFLAITDEDRQVVDKFLKNTSFDYQIIVNGKEIRKKYRVNAFPTHFVVSPDGKIVLKQVGYLPGTKEKLHKRISTLLGKGV